MLDTNYPSFASPSVVNLIGPREINREGYFEISSQAQDGGSGGKGNGCGPNVDRRRSPLRRLNCLENANLIQFSDQAEMRSAL